MRKVVRAFPLVALFFATGGLGRAAWAWDSGDFCQGRQTCSSYGDTLNCQSSTSNNQGGGGRTNTNLWERRGVGPSYSGSGSTTASSSGSTGGTNTTSAAPGGTSTAPAPSPSPTPFAQQILSAAQFGTKTQRGFNSLGDTSAQSLSDFAATGANLARMFLYINQVSGTNTYAIDQNSSNTIDALLSAGAQKGFKVVICLRANPDNSFFGNSGLIASMDSIWQSVAKKYLGNPTVAAYDLYNEPIAPNGAAQWNAIANQLITDIRKIDPNHAIIYEPSPGGIPESFNGFTPAPFSNIVYSVHM